MGLEDADLVARARLGDTEAFDALVERHQHAMMAIAAAYCQSEADVEDAVQEAFVKAYRSLADLADGSRFAAWLARIVVNTCMDMHRARSNRVSLDGLATSVAARPRLGQSAPSPSSLVGRAERADRLAHAIAQLPQEQQVVLRLRYAEGMSYEQIAQYLDVPPSTVRGRLRNAKVALRDALREFGSEAT